MVECEVTLDKEPFFNQASELVVIAGLLTVGIDST